MAEAYKQTCCHVHWIHIGAPKNPNAEAVDIFISVVRRSCHDPDFDLA